MRINTNVPALNTYSRLTSANNAKSDSLAKLSSGLRIKVKSIILCKILYNVLPVSH